MPFKNGTWEHTSGFVIVVDSAADEPIRILITPSHPMTLTIADFFDLSKWSAYTSG